MAIFSIFDKKKKEEPKRKLSPYQAYSKALVALKQIMNKSELKPLVKGWSFTSHGVYDKKEIQDFKNGNVKEAFLGHFESYDAWEKSNNKNEEEFDKAYEYWEEYYYAYNSSNDLFVDLEKAIGDKTYSIYAEDKSKSCSFYIVNNLIKSEDDD